MRITGGKYLGRTVEIAKGGLDIRPAMDRMRESVFGVLGDMSGLSFLDLFSGSGIIALEAASRGASPVVAVEKDKAKFPMLIRNLSIAEERIECKSTSTELFIARNKMAFQVVFCDPPFPYRYRSELLRSLSERPSSAPGGLVLIHFPVEDRLLDSYGPLRLEDERIYGRSHVRFYRKVEE
jgi:16S rRNA (guanine(966)-N(2))-methyltransferase RsmD